jgi:hypothetical protein
MTTQDPSTPPSTQALSSLPSLPIPAPQPPALPTQEPVLPNQAQALPLPQARPQAPQSQAPQPQALPTQVPIMADYAEGVKKVPFDGTQENFYLWTTQLLGFGETYNCEQALLGQLKVPAYYDVLDPTTDKELLLVRRANSTAKRISLTDKISQSALYNSKTKELPLGSAAKAGTICLHCITQSMLTK